MTPDDNYDHADATIVSYHAFNMATMTRLLFIHILQYNLAKSAGR